MKKTYFTVTGIWFHYGSEVFHRKEKVKLVKEPDNKYDPEAIRVEIKGLGKVGYVANSPNTVMGKSISAGRMYDRIGKKAKGRVVAVTERGILCCLCQEKKSEERTERKEIANDSISF